MTFVQNQEIIMPENVGYVTELIARSCYIGLSHTKLGPAGVNMCMFCSLLDLQRNVFLQIPDIVHHGKET